MPPSTTNSLPGRPSSRWARRIVCWLGWVLGILTLSSRAEGIDPFHVGVDWAEGTAQPTLRVQVTFPERHYLYAESLLLTFDSSRTVETGARPGPVLRFEAPSRLARLVYDQPIELKLAPPITGLPAVLEVQYQGCAGERCFLPQTRRWRIAAGKAPELLQSAAEELDETSEASEWDAWIDDFRVVGRGGGHPAETEFLKFLRAAQSVSEEPIAPLGSFRIPLALGWALILLVSGSACILRHRHWGAKSQWVARLGVALTVLGVGSGGIWSFEQLASKRPTPAATGQLLGPTDLAATEVERTLEHARLANRPVLLALGRETDRTLLDSGDVRRELSRFDCVWLDGSQLSAGTSRTFATQFAVRSLPAFILLEPREVSGLGQSSETACEPGSKHP